MKVNINTGHPAHVVQVVDAETAYEQNIENWLRLPVETRRRVIAHVRATLIALGYQKTIDHWANQVMHGVPVASDDAYFHFGAGMSIRNICRRVLDERELPPVRQPFEEMSSNWDDYYLGMLVELAWEESDWKTAEPQPPMRSPLIDAEVTPSTTYRSLLWVLALVGMVALALITWRLG